MGQNQMRNLALADSLLAVDTASDVMRSLKYLYARLSGAINLHTKFETNF